MAVLLTDAEIDALVNEEKYFPNDYKPHWVYKGTHKQSSIKCSGKNGNIFFVKIRQNTISSSDFSVILGIELKRGSKLFRLRRYNGRHQHFNNLERERFLDFHIHYATERYQRNGQFEETYAQPTHRYSDLGGAFRCMVDDCNFVTKDLSQLTLF